MDSYGNVARIVQQEKHNIGFSRKERMAFLLRWSEVKVYHKRSYSRRRNGSSADSWKRILRDLCWVCRSADATARHHIIQICDGCHAEVHHWMDASDHPIVKEAKAMDSCPFNRLPL
jgi:hypothetical protein